MAYCPLSGLPVFDQGFPVDGAQVFAFDADTTAPRALYLTSDLDPAKIHPVPVVTIDGVLPVMWAGAGDYDLRILGPDDALIRTISGLPGDPTAASTSTAFDPQAQPRTGDVITAHGTGSRAGWVRCNGLTIGSGASTGAERANDDCHALFVWLWTYDQSLVVSGGRATAGGAEADWQANKTIALPDDRARVEIGTPDMGAADVTATRLSGGLAPNGAVLGATGGEAAHALVSAEVGLPVTITTSGSTNVASSSGAAAHNTLPPFIARTRYMKL